MPSGSTFSQRSKPTCGPSSRRWKLALPQEANHEPGPPPVTLAVQTPLPEPARDPGTGVWTQEIDIKPSRRDAVPDVFVEVEFDRPYREGKYEVMQEIATAAISLQERFGTKGATDSKVFTMGLVELPRRAWIRLTFKSKERLTPIRMGLNPFAEQS